MFILWPLAQLLLLLFGESFGLPSASDMLLKAHQLWLLYYYTTLSLRENILLANGSNIMQWWILHHYVRSHRSGEHDRARFEDTAAL